MALAARNLGWTLVLCVVASACRPISLNSDPTTTDRRGASLALYSVEWWQRLVAERTLEYDPLETAMPVVDPDTHRVIVLTRDGMIRSLHPEGKVEWSHQTPHRFYAGATVHEGTVFVPGGEGTLRAFESLSGTAKWTYASGEVLGSRPTVAGDLVLVSSESDAVFAVNRQTGAWVWQYRRETPSGFTIRGVSGVTVSSSGRAYVGFSDGTLVALKVEDGSVLWTRALSPEARFSDVDTTPVVDEESGRIYAASFKEGLYALNLETGEVIWKQALTGLTQLLFRNGVLFATGDAQVLAVMADTGRTIWTRALEGRAGRMPVFAKRNLVVPVGHGLGFIDPTTGQVLQIWDPGQGVSATPAWADARLYVLSNLGFLYALSLQGGG